jgi:hypothetical protein
MNAYYSGRSSRLAGLFSFGLLDGPPWVTVSRTGRLTNSPARTNMARLFSAPCALREAHGEGARPMGQKRVSARLGWAGEKTSGVGGWNEWLRSQPLRDGIHE